MAREGRAAGAGIGNTRTEAENIQLTQVRGGRGSNRRPPDVHTGAANISMPHILSSGGSGQNATRKPARGRKRGSGVDRGGLSATGPRGGGGGGGNRSQGTNLGSGRAEAGGGGKRSRKASGGGGAGGAIARGPAQRQHDTLADAPNLQMKVTFQNPVRTADLSSEPESAVRAAKERCNLAHGSMNNHMGPSLIACSKVYNVSGAAAAICLPSTALYVTSSCTIQHRASGLQP